MFDIIIAGAGPAGMTAGIYSKRAGKSVLIIEGSTIGGQISSSPKVENFPGFKSISGSELSDKLFEQASNLGVEFEFSTIENVVDNGNSIKIKTDYGEFEGLSLIIATGAKNRKLGLSNEEELIGNGICYCVVCDGDFYAGKDVAIIGGGNTALQSAIYLSNICKSVHIVQNLPVLTGEKSLIDEVLKKENILITYNAIVNKLIATDKLNSIEIKVENELKEIKVEGVFVSIGQIPNNKVFENLVKLNDYGYVESDEGCLTSNEKIFVAGDCRVKKVRQLTTAVADGSVASIMACSYVDKIKK